MRSHSFPYRFLRSIKNRLILPDSSCMFLSNQKERESFLSKAGRDSIVLDIGCGNRPVLKCALRLDQDQSFNVDIVCRSEQLPFRDGCADLAWLGGAIEHIRDPEATIREVYRVLKPGGRIGVEVPFFQRIHEAPADYQRFTPDGLRHLLRDFTIFAEGTVSGPSSALSHCLRSYLAILFSFGSPCLHHYLHYCVFGWVTLPIKYLDALISRWPTAASIAFSFYCYGTKLDGKNRSSSGR